MFGYHGRTLIIDLSTGTHREVPLPEAWLRRVIGGVGLGAWLLHEHARPGCDPRGPENALVLASSLWVTRWSVAKIPWPRSASAICRFCIS